MNQIPAKYLKRHPRPSLVLRKNDVARGTLTRTLSVRDVFERVELMQEGKEAVVGCLPYNFTPGIAPMLMQPKRCVGSTVSHVSHNQCLRWSLL